MVKRGSSDSAEVEDLVFDFNLIEFERKHITFWIDFKNPRLVSTGTNQDILNITWFNTDIVRDQHNGFPVTNHTVLISDIPLMFEETIEVPVIRNFGTTLYYMMNTFFVCQIFLCMFIAVPMKSMWLFVNAMQMILYL